MIILTLSSGRISNPMRYTGIDFENGCIRIIHTKTKSCIFCWAGMYATIIEEESDEEIEMFDDANSTTKCPNTFAHAETCRPFLEVDTPIVFKSKFGKEVQSNSMLNVSFDSFLSHEDELDCNGGLNHTECDQTYPGLSDSGHCDEFISISLQHEEPQENDEFETVPKPKTEICENPPKCEQKSETYEENEGFVTISLTYEYHNEFRTDSTSDADKNHCSKYRVTS